VGGTDKKMLTPIRWGRVFPKLNINTCPVDQPLSTVDIINSSRSTEQIFYWLFYSTVFTGFYSVYGFCSTLQLFLQLFSEAAMCMQKVTLLSTFKMKLQLR